MAIYDFFCKKCDASREVLGNYQTIKGLELICVQCGGVMKPSQVAMFNIISSSPAIDQEAPGPQKAKPCGHTHHCRCAIKLTEPNPIQKEIDAALRESGSHLA